MSAAIVTTALLEARELAPAFGHCLKLQCRKCSLSGMHLKDAALKEMGVPLRT